MIALAIPELTPWEVARLLAELLGWAVAVGVVLMMAIAINIEFVDWLRAKRVGGVKR